MHCSIILLPALAYLFGQADGTAQAFRLSGLGERSMPDGELSFHNCSVPSATGLPPIIKCTQDLLDWG